MASATSRDRSGGLGDDPRREGHQEQQQPEQGAQQDQPAEPFARRADGFGHGGFLRDEGKCVNTIAERDRSGKVKFGKVSCVVA
jgi:hypothetical protein